MLRFQLFNLLLNFAIFEDPIHIALVFFLLSLRIEISLNILSCSEVYRESMSSEMMVVSHDLRTVTLLNFLRICTSNHMILSAFLNK